MRNFVSSFVLCAALFGSACGGNGVTGPSPNPNPGPGGTEVRASFEHVGAWLGDPDCTLGCGTAIPLVYDDLRGCYPVKQSESASYSIKLYALNPRVNGRMLRLYSKNDFGDRDMDSRPFHEPERSQKVSLGGSVGFSHTGGERKTKTFFMEETGPDLQGPTDASRSYVFCVDPK